MDELLPIKEPYSREGHGNPLQNSCLENPMDKGAWQATQSVGFSRQEYWSGLPFPPAVYGCYSGYTVLLMENLCMTTEELEA